MTRLARLSLANRSLIALIALVLAGIGVYAVPQLKQQLLPSLNFPMVSVISMYQGASPQTTEEQVTEPVENAVESLDGVEEITSTSAEGMSTVQVAFDYEIELDDMLGDIQQELDKIEGDLPEDVEPTVAAGSTEDIPVVVLAVSGGDTAEVQEDLESSVAPELEKIEDVQDVAVTGVREDQVTITPDPKELASNGLSAASITQTLQANGIVVPSGTLERDDQTLSVQVGKSFDSVEDLEDLYMAPAAAPGQDGGQQPGGEGPGQGGQDPGQGQQPGDDAAKSPKPVKLGDVADIEREPEAVTSITRTNGQDSLGLSITMISDGNAVGISHEVNDKIDGLEQRLGSDTSISVIFDQAPYVEKSIHDLTTEGALGLIFAVLVIMIFLLSLRSTIVTAVSIPMSVVIALMSLWIGDYSLNMLTLGALTISVGRVVDDSIVVLENIKRHLTYGEEKHAAVIQGVREVAGAVTSSTLTTVAVFLPIAFVSGLVGQLFSSFAVTVTVALLASLLVSLTIIPVLAYWFLRAPKVSDDERESIREKAEQRELRSPLQRMYIPVLRFVTRFKAVTILIGIAIFAGTVLLIPALKTNFIDSNGQDSTQISQTMPAGTSLDATDAAAAKIEHVLSQNDDVSNYQVNIGSSNPMFGDMATEANKATYMISVAEGAQTADVEDDLRDEIEELDGVGEALVGAAQGGDPTGGDGIEVVLQGGDTESLEEASDKVEDAMRDVPQLRDVSSNLSAATPRIEIDVDSKKAAEAGMSEATVGQLVAQVFRGSPLGEMTLDGRNSEIILHSDQDKPASISQIEELELPTAQGMIELSDVADVEEVDGPVEISRKDGERSATLSSVADMSDLGTISQQLDTKLADLDLPEGVDYSLGGSIADQQEAFNDLYLAMVVAIALVFMIMVATFRSFVQPLILLVSIPFAATGAIGLLLLTDTPLGIPAMIGLLMLIGVVVTNAIVLIDLINQYRDEGMTVRDAVIAGGRRRLRPILMTAIATICALIPMAIGLTGSGGFIAQSLAIVVIGGLVSSTVLTLLLVPTLYTIVEGVKERFRNRKERKSQAAASGPPVESSAESTA